MIHQSVAIDDGPSSTLGSLSALSHPQTYGTSWRRHDTILLGKVDSKDIRLRFGKQQHNRCEDLKKFYNDTAILGYQLEREYLVVSQLCRRGRVEIYQSLMPP